MPHLRIGVLALLAWSSQITAQEMLLLPPRNVTLVSEDFRLFLTWLPDAGNPPGTSYAVQWKDPYDGQWEDVPHCRDLPGTRCNITCVPMELHNRYWVQVRAQTRSRAGVASSPWVTLKDIDYVLKVEPAPPMLQLQKTENTLRVNATFSYPSCAKDIFQHQISYNLEVWTMGTVKKKRFDQLEGNGIELNTTQWGSGNYCLHAQSYFQATRKWSNLSQPICTQLHEKGASLQGQENWTWMVVPLLLLVLTGPFGVFFWSKHKFKETSKMPQALDFSTFQIPRKWLEFDKTEVITVDALICTGVPQGAGKRSRSPHQVHIARSPLHSLSEEEDEDVSGSSIPYTEIHRFKMKDAHSQMGMMLYPTSKSGNVPPLGGGLPAVMVSGPLVSTVWVAEDATPGSSESQQGSLSENSLMDNPLDFPTTSPPARGEGQEDAGGEVTFWPRSPRLDSVAPPRQQFMGGKDHPKATCGTLDISWLLQGQLIGLESFEKDLRECRGLMEETPLLMESCKVDMEAEVPGGAGEAAILSKPRFHGYKPNHLSYLARMHIA